MPKISAHFESAGVGGPVLVVFGPAGAWEPVWPDLVGLTTVFRYDRGGLSSPHNALDIVTDMRAQLNKAEAATPYILVGHSFGGMVMQLYARLFPDEVKAVVLIDSVHEDQVAKFYEFSREQGDGLIAEIAEVHQGLDYAAGEKQLQAAPPLNRKMPLTVISRGKQTDVAILWSGLQSNLASQSNKSNHIIAVNSGHAIQFDEPQVIVSAIRAVIA